MYVTSRCFYLQFIICYINIVLKKTNKNINRYMIHSTRRTPFRIVTSLLGPPFNLALFKLLIVKYNTAAPNNKVKIRINIFLPFQQSFFSQYHIFTFSSSDLYVCRYSNTQMHRLPQSYLFSRSQLHKSAELFFFQQQQPQQ